ncbi:MAG TPA: transposase [Terriglobales bacterium]
MLIAKPGKHEYRRRLPHLQGDDAPVFVTFRTWARLLLPESLRDLVLKHCLPDHGTKMLAHAVVVMPEHVHLLFTPLRDSGGDPFTLIEIMQCLKGASAHTINRFMQRSGPVWEEESFDHVVRSYATLDQKVEYIRQNPVRRRLVSRPEEYRWLWVNDRLL